MNDEIVVHGDGSRVAVLELIGEHGEYSATKIGRTIEGLFDERRHLVVDLRRATFLDLSAFSKLLTARRASSELGLGFAVVIASTTGWPVRRLFEVTGLQDALAVVPSLADAIKRVRAGGSERRKPKQRRSGLDRRQRATPRPVNERRNVGERRSSLDRRTPPESEEGPP